MNRPRSPWLNLAIISSCLPFVAAVQVMLVPLLVAISEEFDTSIAVAGQVATATFITWSIAAPIGGPFADAYGRRFVILLGMGIAMVRTVGSGLAWDFWSLVFFRLVTGIGAAIIPASVFAAAADLFPPQRRARALGVSQAAGSVGQIVTALLVPIIAGVGGWRWTFYAVGAFGLLTWAVLFFQLPRDRRSPDARLDFKGRLSELSKNAAFWHLIAVNWVHKTATFGAVGYFAAYLIKEYGLEEQDTSAPLTALYTAMTIALVIGGFLTAQGKQNMMLIVTMTIGAGLAAPLFIVDSGVWVTTSLAIAFTVSMILGLPFMAMLAMQVSGRSRATAAGLFGSAIQMGFATGSAFGGIALGLGGFEAAGYLFTGLGVLSIVVLLMRIETTRG